jgi:hypothetical protein
MRSADPRENKQLRMFIFVMNFIGLGLSFGWWMQDEPMWYMAEVYFGVFSLFGWAMTYFLRNNP